MIRLLRACTVASLSVALSGCAGFTSLFVDPAVGSDELDERGPPELSKIKELSGDRRLVRVEAYKANELEALLSPEERDGVRYFKYRVCAETHADAIAARGASSTLTVTDEGELSDATTQALTATTQRSEVSDVVRQLAWQWCNAQLNGDLKDGEYEKALWALQTGALDVLKAKSSVAADKAAAEKSAADAGKASTASEKSAGEAAKSATAAAASATTAKAQADKAAGSASSSATAAATAQKAAPKAPPTKAP